MAKAENELTSEEVIEGIGEAIIGIEDNVASIKSDIHFMVKTLKTILRIYFALFAMFVAGAILLVMFQV